MAGPSQIKKRRRGEETVRRPKKKIKHFKKQKEYHSGSESENEEAELEDTRSGANSLPVALERPKKATEPLKPSKAESDPDAEAEVSSEEDSDEVQEVNNVAAVAERRVTAETGEEDDVDLDADDIDLDEEIGSSGSEIEDDDFLSDNLTGSDADSDDMPSGSKKPKKRNDPSAFANSMSKILSSKLSTSKRSDPVLSRSVDAATANRELTDARLEEKARRKLRAEKRQALEKGRVKDVLGLDTPEVSTAGILEQENRLKKTAQRGVVKLFNAVRAAQVQGEVAREGVRKEGVVGIAQREERVSEMSKRGFLDLIAQGGKKAPAMNVQEA